MRSSEILTLLYFLLPANAVPVPIIPMKDSKGLSGGVDPRTPAPLSTKHTVPANALAQLDDSLFHVPIDNRPISPTTAVPPSIILASPQPIESTYLLSLASPLPKSELDKKDRKVEAKAMSTTAASSQITKPPPQTGARSMNKG